MNNDKIPFDIDKWKAGWKPVTRDGEYPEAISTWIFGYCYRIGKDWRYVNGLGELVKDEQFGPDLMLIPPDEIVVEVVQGEDYTKSIIKVLRSASNLTPGKYKLVKI